MAGVKWRKEWLLYIPAIEVIELNLNQITAKE